MDLITPLKGASEVCVLNPAVSITVYLAFVVVFVISAVILLFAGIGCLRHHRGFIGWSMLSVCICSAILAVCLVCILSIGITSINPITEVLIQSSTSISANTLTT